ncbi:hypothetical protein CYY_002573 [Polysphondylium violaceum]|uniref:DEAD/DEAH box helicase n=1 Tax=Polysphondylium violaceum TaxID=133409 RepID=A0A8J4UV03_9MYCE|nr:hypothetical protein CYY_002573 [Polysphondylium violaceum]
MSSFKRPLEFNNKNSKNDSSGNETSKYTKYMSNSNTSSLSFKNSPFSSTKSNRGVTTNSLSSASHKSSLSSSLNSTSGGGSLSSSNIFKNSNAPIVQFSSKPKLNLNHSNNNNNNNNSGGSSSTSNSTNTGYSNHHSNNNNTNTISNIKPINQTTTTTSTTATTTPTTTTNNTSAASINIPHKQEDEDFDFEFSSQFSAFTPVSQEREQTENESNSQALFLDEINQNLEQSKQSQHAKDRETQFRENKIKTSKLYPISDIDPLSISNDINECCEKLFLLPKQVGITYQRKGITKLYDWQKECLSRKDVQGGENLVYSLPTSGGKTMVAEIILLRNTLLRKKKSLFIFPYVSIVTEKAESLQEFGQNMQFKVEAYYGCNGTVPVPPGNGMFICTIEKANIVVNQLIEDNRIEEIGCVVVDEFHMVGDGERGETLEMLISKLLYISRGKIQIVGMSATIPNLTNLQRWLRGSIYEGNFRPVPLTEYIKIGSDILDNSGKLVRKLDPLPPMPHATAIEKEMPHIVSLCLEVIPAHSVLVFCHSKQLTYDTAKSLASLLPAHILNHKLDERETLIQLLSSANGVAIEEDVKAMIKAGVAFHNSNLTNDEREIIEKGFKEHTIHILCATSTLSAGVNLPARRVILRSPKMGGYLLSPRQYRQMVGRAGRAGIDEFGESILVCDAYNAEKAKKLVVSPIDTLISMIKSDKSFQKIVLDAISANLAKNIDEILDFVSFTLFFTQRIAPTAATTLRPFEKEIGDAIQVLHTGKYVQYKVSDKYDDESKPKEYESTGLGLASFRSCLNIQESALIHQELKKAQEDAIVISEDLHMCFITTPLFNLPPLQPQHWSIYLNLLHEMDSNQTNKAKKKVANIVGINSHYVNYRIDEQRAKPTVEPIYQRFYCAMALRDMIHETPLHMTSKKYALDRGTLQLLMQSSSSFAWMVSFFCKKMNWNALELLVGLYIQRLDKGVKQEITPLVEIPGVKQQRARLLWNAGFKTVKSIASATPEQIAKSIKMGKFAEQAARKLIKEAKDLLERKSEELREKANELLLN